MKRKLLSFILAALLATSALPTAFAAVAEVDRGNNDVTQYDEFKDAVENTGAYDTLRLLENVTVDLSNEDWKYGVNLPEGSTFDLNEKELEIVANDVKANDVVVGVDVLGFGDYGAPTTIKNGTITMNVNGDNDADVSAVQIGSVGEVNISDVTVKSTGDADVDVAISSKDTLGYGDFNADITIDNCTIDTGTGTSVAIEDENSKATITSGVYDNLELGDKVVLDESNGTKEFTISPTPGEGDQPGDEPGTGAPAKGPTVIISKDTAAVVVDADGNVKLYNSLDEAKEAVGNGTTVNVVNGLTDAPEGFEITDDGKLVKGDGNGNQGGGNQGGTPPTYPIDPGMPGPGLMSIDDPEVPLAGLVTVADVLEELYKHEGSPDGEDADGETTKAVAWAIANDLIDEETDVEEIVTVAILRDILTKYVDFAEISYTVKLAGEDDDIVDNCGEILTDLFAAD